LLENIKWIVCAVCHDRIYLLENVRLVVLSVRIDILGNIKSSVCIFCNKQNYHV